MPKTAAKDRAVQSLISQGRSMVRSGKYNKAGTAFGQAIDRVSRRPGAAERSLVEAQTRIAELWESARVKTSRSYQAASECYEGAALVASDPTVQRELYAKAGHNLEMSLRVGRDHKARTDPARLIKAASLYESAVHASSRQPASAGSDARLTSREEELLQRAMRLRLEEVHRRIGAFRM